MKKCPKCNTVYVDDSLVCNYCNEKLIETDKKEKTMKDIPVKGNGIVAVLIYTAIFILFIMLLYFVIYSLRN